MTAFTQIDLETSKYLEQEIGTKTIAIKNKGKHTSRLSSHTSDSESISYVARPLMLAQEIRRMSRKKVLIFIEGINVAFGDKLAWFRQKQFQLKNLGAIEVPSLMSVATEHFERASKLTIESNRIALMQQEQSKKATDNSDSNKDFDDRSEITLQKSKLKEEDKNHDQEMDHKEGVEWDKVF